MHRDLEKNVVEVARRDTKAKELVSIDGLANTVYVLLDDIQQIFMKRPKSTGMSILPKQIAGMNF